MQPSYICLVFLAAICVALGVELRKSSLEARRELVKQYRKRRAVADLKDNLDNLSSNLKTLQFTGGRSLRKPPSHDEHHQSLHRQNLRLLRHTVQGLQRTTIQKGKRTCAFGINSHHCALANLNDVMASKEWLGSGFSPGKRSAGGDMLSESEQAQIQGYLNRILGQMQDVADMKRFTDSMDADMNRARRTCRFSLGGRCFTNEMASLVDQTGYLGSASSPGRKRRSTNEVQIRDATDDMLDDSDIV